VLGSPKFAIKSGDAFKGYASIFNAVHLDGSVVEPGAFGQICAPVRLLLEDADEHVIGRVDLIHEDQRGLYVEGVFTSGVTETKGGLSIGFELAKETKQSPRNAHLNAHLIEISLTEEPICPEAQITEIRRC
jgi:HK97 family phage prohead protease